MKASMPTIAIGNIYGHGFDAAKVADIEKLGFVLRPQVGHFAGAQIMRFIDFKQGPALELIDVEDPKEYAEFVPQGMVPYCPGISLLLPNASKKDLDAFAEAFDKFSPYTLHVNYDGSPDPGKPGWNYLNFGIPIVRGTFTYLTVKDEPRPIRANVVSHANEVTGVEGLWFNVDAAELQPLADLVGTDMVDGAFRIGDVAVWSRDALRTGTIPRGKLFPLNAIVLAGPGLPGSELSGPIARKTSFGSKPALQVETNPLSWDLLIVGPPARARRGIWGLL